MPKLVIKTGEKKGLVYRLTEENVSIGRDPVSTLVLLDQRVSLRHAQIIFKRKKYVIVDLGSTNGTIVNNSLVKKQVLKSGDEIKLGGTVLAFLALSAQEGREKALQVRMIPEEEATESPTVEMTVEPSKVKPIEAGLVKPDVGALQKAYQRLMVLYRISYDLGTLMELPRLLDRILELVLDVIKADRGFIMLIDEETGELVPQVVRRSRREGLKETEEIAISKTITNQVLKTGESVLTRDAMRDVRFKDSVSVAHHAIHSAMCVPIKTKEKILGIMHVDTKAMTLGFTKEDLELLSAICNQAVVAIENAKLFSDLKKAVEEIKNRQAQLIQAEKMAAVGMLGGGIAHELNSPLTAIAGLISYVREEMDEKDKKREILERTVKEVKRCSKIVEDLLTFCRPQTEEEYFKANCNEILDRTFAIIGYQLERINIKCIKNYGKDLPEIWVNSNQIQQVFLNLIMNATDAMQGSLKKELMIETRSAENFVEIHFCDTGRGISKENLASIFDPFYSTKETGKGTGLGLTVTRNIIEAHKGKIEITSEEGKGTKVLVRLPLGKQ